MSYPDAAHINTFERSIFPANLLKTLRMISFIAVLLKISSISIWPHIYIGEIYAAPRWRYYLDFIITVLSIGTFFIHLEYAKNIFKSNIFTILFCFIAVLSPFLVGSDNLTSDLLTAISYLEIVSAVMLIVRFDGLKVTTKLLLAFGVFFVTVNILALAQPSRSFMKGVSMPNILLSSVPAFRGLTPHRNDLSWIAFLFLFSALSSAYRFPRFLKWYVIAGSGLLIFLASSVQGILLSLFGLFILLIASDPKILRSPVFVTFALPLVLIVSFFAFSPDSLEAFLNFFGRDLTFTGRDRIWAISFERIRGMPWYGYGQGSLGALKISPELLNQFGVGTVFGTAHNSYIEAILTYGWIGAAVFFSIVGRQIMKVIFALLSGKKTDNQLCFVLILTCAVGGLTASEKLFLPGSGWFFFCLGKYLFEQATVKPR
ncbi:O-antigen ligase family protein [Asticcacaulis sp.]|uniref:O-antigen ligase family protein n=1 Tax=Asticcacaulis sp. TaxID=1872648 RepID=UPI0031DAE2AF